MFTAQLFLGIEVTPKIEEALLAVDPQVRKAFVKDDDVYLRDIVYEGRRYLGKFAGTQADVGSLELLEVNIRSLLAKILPEEEVPNLPIHLFPLVESHRHARK